MSLDYVLKLARDNTDAIGFISQPKLERYEAAGQILVATENGEPCGFLVYGNGWPVMRVYQACIQYDAQRREHGLHLVERLETVAAARGVEAISLWCATDLEANEFWCAGGFEPIESKAGGSRRGRQLTRYQRKLSHPAQPALWSVA